MGNNEGARNLRSLPDRGAELTVGSAQLPQLIVRAGWRAIERFVEFFVATIRNPNTRAAYAQGVGQFCSWCERRGIQLSSIRPVIVAVYIEALTTKRSAPNVKQHLARTTPA